MTGLNTDESEQAQHFGVLSVSVSRACNSIFFNFLGSAHPVQHFRQHRMRYFSRAVAPSWGSSLYYKGIVSGLGLGIIQYYGIGRKPHGREIEGFVSL